MIIIMAILCLELEEKLSLVSAEAESLVATSQTSQQKGEIIISTSDQRFYICLMRRNPYI